MENRQLAVTDTQAMMPQAALSKEKLTDYLNIAGVATKLSEKERMNFIEIAQAYCLNPFKREIYCVSYGYGDSKTTSIITGYEVYIKKNGKYVLLKKLSSAKTTFEKQLAAKEKCLLRVKAVTKSETATLYSAFSKTVSLRG